jgi:hypothetical protein
VRRENGRRLGGEWHRADELERRRLCPHLRADAIVSVGIMAQDRRQTVVGSLYDGCHAVACMAGSLALMAIPFDGILWPFGGRSGAVRL